MDGLALLCNLFADGPVTLERLRRARVAGLEELERLPPAQLAEWLHASEPQARAFAEEARKLVRRLGPERRSARVPEPVRRAAPPPRPAPVAEQPAGRASADALRPGLFAGLDEAVCGRLHAQGVRTVPALIAGAGLSLARRTGIPYLALLALARNARRAPEVRSAAAPESLAQVEVVPQPRPARLPEPARSDEFSLPPVEPEAAGPFV